LAVVFEPRLSFRAEEVTPFSPARRRRQEAQARPALVPLPRVLHLPRLQQDLPVAGRVEVRASCSARCRPLATPLSRCQSLAHELKLQLLTEAKPARLDPPLGAIRPASQRPRSTSARSIRVQLRRCGQRKTHFVCFRPADGLRFLPLRPTLPPARPSAHAALVAGVGPFGLPRSQHRHSQKQKAKDPYAAAFAAVQAKQKAEAAAAAAPAPAPEPTPTPVREPVVASASTKVVAAPKAEGESKEERKRAKKAAKEAKTAAAAAAAGALRRPVSSGV
jgi:hypothetical protein